MYINIYNYRIISPVLLNFTILCFIPIVSLFFNKIQYLIKYKIFYLTHINLFFFFITLKTLFQFFMIYFFVSKNFLIIKYFYINIFLFLFFVFKISQYIYIYMRERERDKYIYIIKYDMKLLFKYILSFVIFLLNNNYLL